MTKEKKLERKSGYSAGPENNTHLAFTFSLTFHGKSDKVKARQVIPAPGCSNPFRKTRLNCLSGFGWKAIE